MDSELPTEADVDTSSTTPGLRYRTRAETSSNPQGIDTPGTVTRKKVSNRSRAEYSLYLVKDEENKTMAVLIETKLSSNASFAHAVAQVSPLFVFVSFGRLSSLFVFSCAGHWVLCEI